MVDAAGQRPRHCLVSAATRAELTHWSRRLASAGKAKVLEWVALGCTNSKDHPNLWRPTSPPPPPPPPPPHPHTHYEMFANKTRRLGCFRCGRPSVASITSNGYLRRLLAPGASLGRGHVARAMSKFGWEARKPRYALLRHLYNV